MSIGSKLQALPTKEMRSKSVNSSVFFFELENELLKVQGRDRSCLLLSGQNVLMD